MSFHPTVAASQPAAYHAPAAASGAPPGTFAPGTKVQVGKHRVVIERYLSEGGFAHVYIVRVPRADNKFDIAVLKRVAVPDKERLANMRTEVETMKKLKGHRHIVTYIDSHASQLKGGGYEVFLLMEYCSGGGLIDFMNTRLQHRLTEPEILKIFSDVAEGVACMHYLKPPLLHRDLKVENVLISTSGSSKIYKLCDFGSSAPPRPAATTAAEGRLIEDDVQRHTTLQYRSPEMIDVYRKQPIDEKSDIWALGVLLYKLCYYTTPFEEQGQMAILNATFRYPPYPSFSDRTKKLIASMLQENPKNRPNIYQVVREVCSMRGTEVPIRDIYSERTPSEARRNQQLPSPEPRVNSPPVVGISTTAPVQTVQAIPDITPMRRGRPTAPAQQTPVAKPSPSPMRPSRNDPFAALDSANVTERAAAADELAAKFPSLDEFSILHDKGSKFQFGPTSPKDVAPESLNKRVTEALADEAFARAVTPRKSPVPSARTSASVSRSASFKSPAPIEPKPKVTAQSQAPQAHHLVSPKPQMVSTGTMTSPPSSPPLHKYPDLKQRPIYRFPPPESSKHHHRALSLPRPSSTARTAATPLTPNPIIMQPSSSHDLHHSRSQTPTLISPKPYASSRPSLEGQRPSVEDLGDPISRSRSANSQLRPSSVHVGSDLDYLRDREASKGHTFPQSRDEVSKVTSNMSGTSESGPEGTNISSDVDFLRAMEGEDAEKRKDRRSSSGTKHSKRSSLPSMSLSNTKNKLAGKFGEAFRRFEGNTAGSEHRAPSPSPDHSGGSVLAPIAGSITTEDRSDNEEVIDETEDLSPEVRRELERRRLSQEEKRVAEAAAEYRKRVAVQGDGKLAGGGGSGSRASTIQNRVKTLLDESGRASPVKRTAEGYGHFTDDANTARSKQPEELKPKVPVVARKPVVAAPSPVPANLAPPKMRQPVPIASPPSAPASAPPAAQRIASRPAAPPKPKALRTGSQMIASQAPATAQLPPLPNQPAMPISNDMGMVDLEADFSKRFPSLSGLEMVEADIGTAPKATKIRDV